MFRFLKNDSSPWPTILRAPDGDGGAGGSAPVEPPAAAQEQVPEADAGQGETPPAEETSFLDKPGSEGSESEGSGEGFQPVAALTDLTLPEGLEVSEELGTEFLGILNDRGLSAKEQGEKLLGFHARVLEEASAKAQDSIAEQWEQLQSQWKAEAAQAIESLGVRPEVGAAQINKGLRAAGADDATFEALRVTGAANHPKIVSLLFSLTKGHVEGGQVAGSPVRAAMTQEERLQAFYNHPTSQPQRG